MVTSQFAIPSLYVSHDIGEVSHLSDHITVMTKGRVVSHGATTSVISHLDAGDTAGAYDPGVLLGGTIDSHDQALCLTRARVESQLISTPYNAIYQPGDNIRLRVRARDVIIASERPNAISIRNIFKAVVTEISETPDSPDVIVSVESDIGLLKAQITNAAAKDLALTVGLPVFALVKAMTFDRPFQN